MPRYYIYTVELGENWRGKHYLWVFAERDSMTHRIIKVYTAGNSQHVFNAYRNQVS